MKDFTFYGIAHDYVQKLWQPLQSAFWIQPSQKGISKAAEDIKNWTFEEHTAKKIMAQYTIQSVMSYNNAHYWYTTWFG